MTAKNNDSTLETTLEDLLAAAGELAFEHCDNDKDAYNLVRLAIIELLKKTRRRSDPTRELENLPSPSPLIH
jgi:hypothetical protein